MFQLSTKELAELGAEITTREIKQQPELWHETLTIYQEKQEAIATFLRTIKQKTDKRIRVVFTGAGTSQYVGDTIVPYLNKTGATADYLLKVLLRRILSQLQNKFYLRMNQHCSFLLLEAAIHQKV